jgi:hypothetical protein
MSVEVEVHPGAATNGFADVILQGSGPTGFRTQLDIDYLPIWTGCGPVAEVHSDVLLVAAVVYAADKAVKRDNAEDRWTRSFLIRVPVSDPQLWKRAREPLESCLGFLTGDAWGFKFQKRTSALVRPSATLSGRRADARDISTIGLFSGGLDSLIGAINWLETSSGRLLLVGHHDGDVAGPLGDQRSLLAELEKEYPGRTRHLFVRVGSRPGGEEISFRGRSFLFLGLAAHAVGAAKHGTPILIPENGNIALNVPLTPSRQGSCSTRTAHPYYLDQIRAVFSSLGIDSPVSNLLADKTKGECVRECRNERLLRRLYGSSASCAKRGHHVHWIRRDARQCGRCVPCLYRRAALHAAGWDDELYGFDVCAGDIALPGGVTGAAREGDQDALAMLAFLREGAPQTVIARRLMVNGRIPHRSSLAAAELVGRAMDEVRQLIADKGAPEVRRAAGIG